MLIGFDQKFIGKSLELEEAGRRIIYFLHTIWENSNIQHVYYHLGVLMDLLHAALHLLRDLDLGPERTECNFGPMKWVVLAREPLFALGARHVRLLNLLLLA